MRFLALRLIGPQGPGDASDVAAPLGAVRFGQVVFGENVRDAEPAAGPGTRKLSAKTAALLPDRLITAVGDDHVDRLAGQPDRFDMAVEEFGVPVHTVVAAESHG